jgi:hypothetical protein
MGRRKAKRERPPALSPEERLRNLARQIVTPRYPEHVSPFWDEATAQLLVRLLPGGVDVALERVRSFRSAPDRQCDEPIFDLLADPKIASGILANAEYALSRYIDRRNSGFDPRFHR